MTDWRTWLPLSKTCGAKQCDWQLTRRLSVTCQSCGVSDSRASRFWRLFERFSR